jgi:2-methylcitrate dehydratase
MYPKAHPNRITVVAKSGARYTEQVDYAKGHPKNPLSDRELEEKFLANTRRVLPSRLQREVVEFVWHLEDRNMAELLDLLAS